MKNKSKPPITEKRSEKYRRAESAVRHYSSSLAHETECPCPGCAPARPLSVDGFTRATGNP